MDVPELSHRRLRLEPLTATHLDDLAVAADDESAWTYMIAPRHDRAGMEAWIAKRLDCAAAGLGATWVQITPDGRVAGSTSLYDYNPRHATASAGYTWLATWARGTGLNSVAKRLVLGHAFDNLGLRRLQFTVDARNTRSQAALTKLGATREGVLRQNRVLPDGFIRDTVVYSILAREWPDVCVGLDDLLAGLDARDARLGP